MSFPTLIESIIDLLVKLILAVAPRVSGQPRRTGQYCVRPKMADPQSLRRIAVKLLAMALDSANPHFVRALVAKAIEHLDRASDLEAASALPPRASRDASESQ